jgi:L-threonylcarbamoyladenylate synthase
MQTISIENPSAIKKAAQIIAQGGVLLHPTDTCYGLACNALDQKAWHKLCAIKKMSTNKPVNILVNDFSLAAEIGIFNQKAQEISQKYWPAPLTIIIPKNKNFPNFLNPETNTVGIRQPNHIFCLEIIKESQTPICSTSANISGENPSYNVEEFLNQLKANNQNLLPDLIIDAGEIPKNSPSTIIEIQNTQIKTIRAGDLEINL